MVSAFARLENQTASAVIRRLANAQAYRAGGTGFAVVFENGYQDVIGMESSAPSVLALSCDVHGLAEGDPLQVDDGDWRVVGIQPDGTGMTLLVLERA